MLDIRAKHTKKNMHSLLGLAWAMQVMPFLCLSCRTGATNSVLLGLMVLLWVQKPHRGPQFPSGHRTYEVSTPSKTLGILKCPDVRNEGLIVLMLLTRKKLPQILSSGGESLKTCSNFT